MAFLGEGKLEADFIKIKIEPALFYQACDKLGLLVIQDMPSLRPLQTRKSPNCTDISVLPNNEQQIEFGRQLELMVNQFKSYPSIATWVSKLQIVLRSRFNAV